MYSLVELKIRTIGEAYRTMPCAFTDAVPWVRVYQNIQRDNEEDNKNLAAAFRDDCNSMNDTDATNMEFAASIAECTSKTDLMQLTTIHVLATLRLANRLYRF